MQSQETHPSSPPSQAAIWSAMLAIYIVWGSTYLAIRFAVETMPPFFMAAARFLVAGAILFAVRRFIGDPAPTRTEWKSATIVGLLLLLGGNGCVVWAEQYVPSGLAALLVGTTPLWMVLMDALRPGGRWPSWRVALGIGLGFIGILVLFWPGNSAGGLAANQWTGALVVVLGSIFWAIGSLYSRNARLPRSPLLGTSMEMLTGGVGLLIAGTLTGELSRVDPAGFSNRSLLGLLYLIVFGSLVGFAAYTWLLRVAPTSLVSTYAYVNPLVALVMGYFLGNERFSTRTLGAAVIILASVVLTTLNRGKAAPAATPTRAEPIIPE